MNDYFEDVIRMSYGWFAERSCTSEALASFVADMTRAYPDLDAEKLYAELERLHFVQILSSSSILEDHSNHIDWFNPSSNTGLKRDIDWHFYTHYYDYLTSIKNWPTPLRKSIDTVTSNILCRLEDPTRSGAWDRRGMVMGSVQSGKTANYTGLIAKAIDAGYRFVVVLAGTHESLRSQTQSRLNEEIMGYDLGRIEKFRGQAERIGVRSLFKDHKVVQTLTSSIERGDFRKLMAEQAGIIPSSSGDPIILVVKKNVRILDNLIRWATSIAGTPDEMGQRRVTDVPLLVIDDECDYASVNTRKVVKNEDGLVDEDCNPAKTNELIRKLLVAFDKSVYIGYTATPFANIFIHHDQRHPIFGEDLFPRDFIITIEQPSNYIGAEQIFGMIGDDVSGTPYRDTSRLVKYVSDADEIIPPKHKKDLVVSRLPDTLVEALKAFLLACAVRRLRRVKPAHNSMLIHVTRFTDVQAQVHQFVEAELRRQINRMRNSNDFLPDYESLWTNDFVQTTEALKGGCGEFHHEWDEVLESLYVVTRRVTVRSINGSVKDSLDYRHVEMDAEARAERGEKLEWEEKGFSVIAIGGDKLSRGLTLDGLSVSYYLRASRMYDTLMQMGRWFGYRDGYDDLCRIYTPEELADWYRFIASASHELRDELEYMSLIGEKPKNFGLKVREHPGQLAVTSVGKMRNAERLSLSYSGRISETVVFNLNQCASNKKALACLLQKMKKEGGLQIDSRASVMHWSSVSPEAVVGFLKRYKTEENAARVVNPSHIAQFISKQQDHGSGDLTTWNVAIISKASPRHLVDLGKGTTFGCVERSPLSINGKRVAIRRLVSPSDEWIDFSDEERSAAWARWDDLLKDNGRERPDKAAIPSGPAIRAARPKERGLLLIYPLCGISTPGSYGLKKGEDVIGFAVSFPGSHTTRQVEYRVNSVYQDAED